ncbi:hypothetical protein DFH07DRAFT_728728, partial [Mycena maculata]
PALNLISGFRYHSLLEFHKRCGKAAMNIATPGCTEQWISQEVLQLCIVWRHKECQVDTTWNPLLLRDPKNYGARGVLSWWANYMKNTATNLETRPQSSTVEDQPTLDVAMGEACVLCLRKPLTKKFIPEFKNRVDKAIREVSIL